MDDIAELAGAIDRERIARARRAPIEKKILAGGELFDAVRERMAAGIRWQFPQYDAQQVAQELKRRLAIAERAEQLG